MRAPIAVACIVYFTTAGWADEKPLDFAPLEVLAASEMKDAGMPGAAIAIIRGDKVVFAKGFGVTSVEGGPPVTPDTLFRLGSTTKMFTAAALVGLAEDGKLKLDAPIGDYVKDLPKHFAPLTLHQLLTHTAGVTDETNMFGALDEASMGREIRGWKADFLFTTPGQVYSYSNPGYRIAGLVAEEVGGKSYADVLADRLFRPLGMKRTTFRPTMAMTYPLAQGHEKSSNGAKVIRPASENAAGWPAGSMFSSVNDLSRWAIAFLNDGKVDGKEIVSPAIIKKLSTPHVAVPGERHYGYGLAVADHRGVPVCEHGGSRAGYGSFIRFLPAQKAAVIVLCNTTGGQLTKTLEATTELLAPLGPRPGRRPGKPLTDDEVKKYAGRFTNNRGRAALVEKDGKLYLRRGPGQDQAVTLVEPNHLRMPSSDVLLVPGADGTPDYLFMGGRAMKRIK
jgi:CubicO group peptidase (beta-lactamase class C family)